MWLFFFFYAPEGTPGGILKSNRPSVSSSVTNRVSAISHKLLKQIWWNFTERYTCGQVSVNKGISVLSNYFNVSFEIYYVRLKYMDSIGQVVQLLILRPASDCCTFNSGHVGSRAPNVNKMGCLFYFYTSRVRLKRKYLFWSRKKEIIILHSTNAHVRCTIQQNGSQNESTIEISGCVTVFEDLNNFVDMNGSIYR